MHESVYARFRALCLAMPASTELETWGHPTFRVNNKVFATIGGDEHGTSLSVKATHEEQAELIQKPGWRKAHYVGKHGWVSYDFGTDDDWALIEALVERSWSYVAPKRLVKARGAGA